MKILIDECVPRPLIKLLTGHEARTAQQMGWRSIKNGELIRQAEDSAFALFITSDQNIKYQQNLAGRLIAVLVLSTNHWGVIQSNIGLIEAAVRQIQPGDFVELELPFP
jgi:hypothetical protein